MDTRFVPGLPIQMNGALARFLPPIELGVVEELLRPYAGERPVVLDPFGSSPDLIVEAARCGYAVVTAVNNPIVRLVLRNRLGPPPPADLQAALAELAALPKDDGRLEGFLLGLYQTTCTSCGQEVAADYFVWEDDIQEPVAKAYACPHCNHVGEDETNAEDRRLARSFETPGLHRALALEQVAPKGDPDRDHARAALQVYPARALYALTTLVTRLPLLDMDDARRRAVDTLLLAAFDAADSMWAHPEGRPRPKQLTPSPRFQEFNVWRALERAVAQWTEPAETIPDAEWAAGVQPEPGRVYIFPGPVREFSATVDAEMPARVLTVPPRPNQAFWTLSALWAAWLWGRETAGPIMAALRRRRYDWAWHAGALQLASRHMAEALPPDIDWLAMVPEAEPGYVAAVVSGLDGAGLRLEGWALRADDGQAQFQWRRRDVPRKAGPLDLTELARATAEGTLRRLGEPAPYAVVHAAVAADWAAQGVYQALWRAEGGQPVASLNLALETALGQRSDFVRLDQRQEIETGQFWLTHPAKPDEPLADRVELSVLAALRSEPIWDYLALDRKVCLDLPGVLTPPRGLLLACLASYAEETTPGEWRLRDEDRAGARTEDLEEIRRMLRQLGPRLAYTTAVREGELLWQDEEGAAAFRFVVQETARLWAWMEQMEHGLILVIPGGRAALVAEKARRDPRLAERLASGVRIVKFRHIRRLASDTTLTPANLAERLAVDPPEHKDPQLPLL